MEGQGGHASDQVWVKVLTASNKKEVQTKSGKGNMRIEQHWASRCICDAQQAALSHQAYHFNE
eukprot:m.138279 g.138279  ORF g.138279 m.138279 type:complete len:63 (-) comp14009_c0_seq1:9-197(-)